jgi:hypothetical protein
MSKETFLYPKVPYHGKDYTLENLTFNANLQEFQTRINYIVALETGGKITTKEAYKQIKALWKNLKQSKEVLLK